MVMDYGNIGACDEALALLDEAIASGEPYRYFPLIHYYVGYYAFLKEGNSATAQNHWQ